MSHPSNNNTISQDSYTLFRIIPSDRRPVSFILPIDMTSEYADQKALPKFAQIIPELTQVKQAIAGIKKSATCLTASDYAGYFEPEADFDSTLEAAIQTNEVNRKFDRKEVDEVRKSIAVSIMQVMTQALEKTAKLPFEEALLAKFKSMSIPDILDATKKMHLAKLVVCYRELLMLVNPAFKQLIDKSWGYPETCGLALGSKTLCITLNNQAGFENIPLTIISSLPPASALVETAVTNPDVVEDFGALGLLLNVFYVAKKVNDPNDLENYQKQAQDLQKESLKHIVPLAKVALQSLRTNDFNLLRHNIKKQIAVLPINQEARRIFEEALSISTLFLMHPISLFREQGFMDFLKEQGCTVEQVPYPTPEALLAAKKTSHYRPMSGNSVASALSNASMDTAAAALARLTADAKKRAMLP